MKNICKGVILMLVAAFLTVGLQAKIMESSVAKVGSRYISSNDFNRASKMMIGQYAQTMPQIMEDPNAKIEIEIRLLKQMIEKAIIAEAAEKERIQATASEINKAALKVKQNFTASLYKDGKPTKNVEKEFTQWLNAQGFKNYEKFKERLAEDLSANKYVQKKILSQVEIPDDKEAKKLFDDTTSVVNGDDSSIKKLKNPQDIQARIMLAQNFKMEMEAKVRISHILFMLGKDKNKQKVYKKALGVLKKAKNGDFEKLVKTYSEHKPTIENGGDVGFIIKGQYPKEFEKLAFSLDVGDVGGPVETPVGYHVIKITEKRAAKKLKFEPLKDNLKQFLLTQKRQAKLNELIQKLEKETTITISKEFERTHRITKAESETSKAESKTPKAEK